MYPPFIRIIKASVQGSSMEECRKILDDFHREFERIVLEKDNIVLYPPMPAIVPRVNNVYKANMLIKTSDRKLAEEKIVTLLTYDRTFKKRILFDADPMFMDWFSENGAFFAIKIKSFHIFSKKYLLNFQKK